MVNPISSSNTSPLGEVPPESAAQLEEVKVLLANLVPRFLGLVGGEENIANLPPKWQSYLHRGLAVAATIQGLTSADLPQLPYNFVGTAKRYLDTLQSHITLGEDVKERNGWTDLVSHLGEAPLVKAVPKLLDHSYFLALEKAEEVLHIG
ncbi:hypothetical protein [Estrella lausannensis]|uniref:Uncharacterized protein n=1 Tax=Estrella lausannensis TaxID=483423 RepID=A0A0H5DPA9_9BACT|nr:hypothetical protein [Estrella lausannensis]CRX37783.1 hypothetical protein ELAC_0427 [Estrella lausannensis]